MYSGFTQRQPSREHPLSDEEIQERTERFRKSISLNLVSEAVEQFVNPPRTFVISPENITVGTTFVCILVQFLPQGSQDWLVRIPVPTTLDDDHQWEVTLREWFTLKHIRKNHSTIPVPTVKGFGLKPLLYEAKTLQPFIITERMPGEPLNYRKLGNLNFGQRVHLASQIADVLAELETEKLPRTGSLDGRPMEHGFYIGPHASRTDSHLSDRDGVPRNNRRQCCLTARESILQHKEHFSDICERVLSHCPRVDQQPVQDRMAETDAVLSSMNLDESFGDSKADFVLNKSSFRMRDVLVDAHGNLVGITSWAWSEILPRQLCVPPKWLLRLVHDLSVQARQLARAGVIVEDAIRSRDVSAVPGLPPPTGSERREVATRRREEGPRPAVKRLGKDAPRRSEIKSQPGVKDRLPARRPKPADGRHVNTAPGLSEIKSQPGVKDRLPARRHKPADGRHAMTAPGLSAALPSIRIDDDWFWPPWERPGPLADNPVLEYWAANKHVHKALALLRQPSLHVEQRVVPEVDRWDGGGPIERLWLRREDVRRWKPSPSNADSQLASACSRLKLEEQSVLAASPCTNVSGLAMECDSTGEGLP